MTKLVEIIENHLNEQDESNDNLNENFWKWFRGSKVVYNGNPVPVYHGSHSDFEEFMGDTYFTDDYMNADGYASGEYVYECYISIKTPLVVDAKDKKWDEIETGDGKTSTRSIVDLVDRSKYDGVIFINIKDSWIDDVDYQDPSTVYVTFEPTQIKSTQNDGSWDVSDKNIYS